MWQTINFLGGWHLYDEAVTCFIYSETSSYTKVGTYISNAKTSSTELIHDQCQWYIDVPINALYYANLHSSSVNMSPNTFF